MGGDLPGQLTRLRIGKALARGAKPFDRCRMGAPSLVELIERADRRALKFRPKKFWHALNRGEPRHPVPWLAEFSRNFGLGVAGVQTARDELGYFGCAQ